MGFLIVYVLLGAFSYLFTVSPISTTVLNTFDTYMNKVIIIIIIIIITIITIIIKPLFLDAHDDHGNEDMLDRRSYAHKLSMSSALSQLFNYMHGLFKYTRIHSAIARGSTAI